MKPLIGLAKNFSLTRVGLILFCLAFPALVYSSGPEVSVIMGNSLVDANLIRDAMFAVKRGVMQVSFEATLIGAFLFLGGRWFSRWRDRGQTSPPVWQDLDPM